MIVNWSVLIGWVDISITQFVFKMLGLKAHALNAFLLHHD